MRIHHLRQSFRMPSGGFGNPSASLLEAFGTDSGSKYLRHRTFNSFKYGREGLIGTASGCSASLREPFGNPSASLPRHRQAFGKPSGSDPETFASSASLRDASGSLRRLIRNPSATLRQLFRIGHAEYMPSTRRMVDLPI